jgi:hypothetical protein
MEHVIKPKIGEFVWCYYDGKGGRPCPGKCIRRIGSTFIVKFLTYAWDVLQPENVKHVTVAFSYAKTPNKVYGDINRNVKTKRNPYMLEGWVSGKGECGILRMLGEKRGDYYAIFHAAPRDYFGDYYLEAKKSAQGYHDFLK